MNVHCFASEGKIKIASITESPYWEATCSPAVNKFPEFYGKPNDCHPARNSPSILHACDILIQPTSSHKISWRYSLYFSFYLRLDFGSGLFPSSFPTSTPTAFLFPSNTWYIPSPNHCPWFIHPNNIWLIIYIRNLFVKFCPGFRYFLHFGTKFSGRSGTEFLSYFQTLANFPKILSSK